MSSISSTLGGLSSSRLKGNHATPKKMGGAEETKTSQQIRMECIYRAVAACGSSRGKHSLADEALRLLSCVMKVDGADCVETLSNLISFDDSDLYILLEPCGPMFDKFLVSNEALMEYVGSQDKSQSTVDKMKQHLKEIYKKNPTFSDLTYIISTEHLRVHIQEKVGKNVDTETACSAIKDVYQKVYVDLSYRNSLQYDNHCMLSQVYNNQKFKELLSKNLQRKRQLDEFKFVCDQHLSRVSSHEDLLAANNVAIDTLTRCQADASESALYKKSDLDPKLIKPADHLYTFHAFVSSTYFMCIPLMDEVIQHIREHFNVSSEPSPDHKYLYVSTKLK